MIAIRRGTSSYVWLLASFVTSAVAGESVSARPPELAAVHQQRPTPTCLQRQTEDFVPMTLSQRLTYALETAVGPTALFFNATRAAINQAKDSPTEWGQGGVGYGAGLAMRTPSELLQPSFSMAVLWPCTRTTGISSPASTDFEIA